MKFQRSAPRVLIFSVVVVVIAMAVLSNRLFSGLTSAVEQDQFELIRALWSYNLTAAENRALERAELIAALPAVREAFAARDREALLAQCAEMFKRQKERYGVDQAQFHFLRRSRSCGCTRPSSMATTRTSSGRWSSRSIAICSRAKSRPLPERGRPSSG